MSTFREAGAIDKPRRKVGAPKGNTNGHATAGKPRVVTLTRALGVRICKRLSDGLPFGLACQAEGVAENTAYEWVRRGEGKDERPPTPLMTWFAAEKHKARARWAQSTIKEIAADPDWHAKGWLLERVMPEHFSRPSDRLEVTGAGGGSVRVELAFDTATLVDAVNARRALMRAPVIDVAAEEIP